MRILITLLAVVAFMATATAQDARSEKKARKMAKTEAVSTTPAAAPKACCASKAGASAEGQRSCGAKAKADAGASTGLVEAAASDAKTPACCAGKTAGEMKSCHEAKAQVTDGDLEKTEEAPVHTE